MAYTLIHSTGTLIIEENDILTRTATNVSGQLVGIEIDLPGRNYAGYGKYINQDLVDLLENFARYTHAPVRALKGQFWFDTTGTEPLLEIPNEPLPGAPNYSSSESKPLMKYNFGNLGTPEWKTLAAIGNDVYFNFVDAKDVIVREDLIVYDNIYAEGRNIAITQPTDSDGETIVYDKKVDPVTFTLLNQHVDKVEAFGNAIDINIGKSDVAQILEVVRLNNVTEITTVNPHNFVPGVDRVSIIASDPSFNESLTQVLFVDTDRLKLRYNNIGPDYDTQSGDPEVTGTVSYGYVNVKNNLNVTGDVKIEGGNITTSRTRFKILPDNVTNLDIARVAENIYLGNSTDTGKTTIRHNLQVDKDVNIDGGDVTSTNPLLNLFNNTVTTVNQFGDAKTINTSKSYQIEVIAVKRVLVDDKMQVTVTTVTPHGLVPGQNISVTVPSNTSFNDKFVELVAGTENDKLVFKTNKITLPEVTNDTLVSGVVKYSVFNLKSDFLNLDGDIHIKGGDILSNQPVFNILPENTDEINVGRAVDGKLMLHYTSDTANNATGALQVAGGVMVGKDLFVGGGDMITDKTVFNILNNVAETINFGGEATQIYVGSTEGHTTINHDLRVLGSLTVNGPTTYIDSTSIRVKDPIIEIGNAGQVADDGSVAPESLIQTDGKDRGMLLHYFNATANLPKQAFFGWDLSDDWFILSKDTTVSETEVVTVNQYANMRLHSGYFNSSIYVGYLHSSAPVGIEIGHQRLQSGDSYVDFISSNNAVDYNARIIRKSGNDGNFDLTNKGVGNFNIIQESTGNVRVATDIANSTVARIFVNGGSGKVGINTETPEYQQTIQTERVQGVTIGLNINNPYPYDSTPTTSGAGIRFTHSSNDSGSTGVLADIYGLSDSNASNYSGSLVFATRSGTEPVNTTVQATSPKATIYSDGRMVLGQLGDINTAFTIEKTIVGTIPVGSTVRLGIGAMVNSLIPLSMNNGNVFAFKSSPRLQNGSYTINNLYHYGVDGIIKSTVTPAVMNSQYGFYVENNMTYASNNYAFYSKLQAPAAGSTETRWGFYSEGDADNMFKGATTINVASPKPALTIIQRGGGDALRVDDANPDSTPTVIDANGNVIIGHTNRDYVTGKVKVHDREVSITSWSGIEPAQLSFFKSNAVTSPTGPGNFNPVVDCQKLGSVSSYGVNLSNAFSPAAEITFAANGTPTQNRVPTKIIFSTTSKTETSVQQPTERMSLSAEGSLVIGLSQITTTDDNKNVNNNRQISYFGNVSDPIRSGYGYFLASNVDTNKVNEAVGYFSLMSSSNGVGPLALTHFWARSASAVSTQYGFRASAETGNTALTNYSFHTNIPAGTGNWGFYSEYAKSYFGGPVGVQVAPYPNTSLSVGGGIKVATGSPLSGSNSNSGYGFGQDGNTGMFSLDTGLEQDVISFFNNGMESVRIDSSLNFSMIGGGHVQTTILTSGGPNIEGTIIGQWKLGAGSSLELNEGFLAPQGAPDPNTKVGYAFKGGDHDTGMFSPFRTGAHPTGHDNGILAFYTNGAKGMEIDNNQNVILTKLTTGSNTTAGTITGRWTLTAGSRLNATYADLAERFEADAVYEPGTVVELGGDKEVTIVKDELSENVFSVVSDTAAYIMNDAAGNDDTHPVIALSGRVYVKVLGTVKKGDRLVSAGNGYARAGKREELNQFNVIGRSLENKTTTEPGKLLMVVMANV